MHTTTSPGGRTARHILRGGIALAIPLLFSVSIAAPAQADPGDPADQASPVATTATTMDTGGGPPPRPPADPPAEQAQVPDELPAAPAVPTEPASGGSGQGAEPAANAAPAATAADAASAQAPAAARAPGERVVVCKYVRKPGVREVAHHVIIVNEQALIGRGFPGTFPWAFSDAHFNSVAVRYAADGERARDVSLASCPRQGGGTEPPAPPQPPGGNENLPGPAGVTQGPGASEAEPPTAAEDVLPQTGAPAGLEGFLLYATAAIVAGLAMLRRKVRSIEA